MVYTYVIIPTPVYESLQLCYFLSMLKDVTDVYLPLLWFEEEAVMPYNLAWRLKLLLVIMNTPLMTIIFVLVMALGLLGASLILFFRYKNAKARESDTKL